MCKITIVDFKIEKHELIRLLMLNSLSGNEDGFGFYAIDDKTLYKTAMAFSDDYLNIIKQFPKSLRGMYHVRKASTFNNYVPVDKDAHPFTDGNIIVMHNGALNFRHTHKNSTEEISKVVDNKDVDSYQYTKVLSKILDKSNLNFEAIKTATSLFSGPFVIVHYDVNQPGKVFISRGKDRILHFMQIKDADGSPVGALFNTTYQELYQYICISELLNKKGLHGDIKLLEENTTYEYNFGSFQIEQLGKIEQDSPYVAKGVYSSNYQPTNRPAGSVAGNDAFLIEDLLVLLDLLKIDSWLLPHIFKSMFNKSILSATYLELLKLHQALQSIHKGYYSKIKAQYWEKYISRLSELYSGESPDPNDIYEDLQFPFCLNSGKAIKRRLSILDDLKEVK